RAILQHANVAPDRHGILESAVVDQFDAVSDHLWRRGESPLRNRAVVGSFPWGSGTEVVFANALAALNRNDFRALDRLAESSPDANFRHRPRVHDFPGLRAVVLLLVERAVGLAVAGAEEPREELPRFDFDCGRRCLEADAACFARAAVAEPGGEVKVT